MNIARKIRKPYIRKFIIWLLTVSVLALICIAYHSSPNARFPPLFSAGLIAIISILHFFSLGIPKYLCNRGFSGRIVDMRVYSKLYMKSALGKNASRRTFVAMKIECDDGKAVKYEQMLPESDTNAIPYRVGDRVMHIKGAPHVCRFPRGDTEIKYEPISVICPLCGAILPLGSKSCSFCETELPYDPAVK